MAKKYAIWVENRLASLSDFGENSVQVLATPALRLICRLDLDDRGSHHLTFSEDRPNSLRENDMLHHAFERVVAACMAQGLIKGEGFPVDAIVRGQYQPLLWQGIMGFRLDKLLDLAGYQRRRDRRCGRGGALRL